METIVKKVTPKMAETFLLKNKKNRNISENHIEFLSNQMKSGFWKFNGDPIRFDTNDNLIDGQHRLTALIRTGKSFDFVIISGLEPDVFDSIDTGKNRAAYDVLKIEGHKYPNEKSVIAKKIITYRLGKMRSVSKISNSEVLKFVELNPRIENVCRLGVKYSKAFKMIKKTTFGYLCFLFTEVDEYYSESFFHKLTSGLELQSTDMIYKLRARLINDFTNERTRRMPMLYKEAIIIKAWNFWRENKVVQKLVFNDSEKYPTAK